MKLRLRSIQSKDTFKVELPNSSTVSYLKQILSQLLPDPPPPASIRFSLNRKDDIQSHGEEFLASLGIASGDLIFFSFQRQIQPEPEPGMIIATSSNPQNTTHSPPNPESQTSTCIVRNSDSQKALGMEKDSTDYMEVEKTLGNEISPNSHPFSPESVENPHSIPVFLRRIFNSEMDNDRKLIVTAIHAVMLDSGFVPFDDGENSNIPIRTSLCYTLPELLNEAELFVLLRFQCLQKFTTVYGTTSSGSRSSTYRVRFDEDQLVPFLNAVWANCGETGIVDKVLGFWRSAKDNLALPLLIDLHEGAGFQLPPCFMQLGSDLKSKILEFLPGPDIARVCCVCTELQLLGSNDNLWRLKFSEEFGTGTGTGTKEPHPSGSWKKAFIAEAVQRRNVVQPAAPYFLHASRRYLLPNPFMVMREPQPRIIGGDHDLYGDLYRLDDGVGRRMGNLYGEDLNRLHDGVGGRRMSVIPGRNTGLRFV